MTRQDNAQGSSSGCFEAWRTRPTTLPSPSGRRITKGLCSYLHKLLPTTTHTIRSTFPLYKTCLSCIRQAYTTPPQNIASSKHEIFIPKATSSSESIEQPWPATPRTTFRASAARLANALVLSTRTQRTYPLQPYPPRSLTTMCTSSRRHLN